MQHAEYCDCHSRATGAVMCFIICILFRIPEHDDRVSFPQRRKKGRGPFRWKCEGNRRSGRGGAGIRSSRLEDDDRDVAMSDAQDVPRTR